MRALRYHAFGGPEQARVEEVPRPVPREGEALVRVRAAALNPVDAKILAGQVAGAAPPRTLGVDFAGEIDGTGERVFGSGPGFGVGVDGAFAEYVAAPRDALAGIPEGLSFEQASALGVVFLTAELCVERSALRVGETLAVFGAGGGVGSACIQLGRAAGARVVAVVSDAEGAGRARALGAAETVDRTREAVAERLRALTAGRGPDVIVDPIGGNVFETAVVVLAPGGRLLAVGVTGGERARVELDLPAFYRKGAAILGVTALPMGAGERGARLARVAARLVRGEIRPPEVEPFPLERGADALERVTAYRTGGRKLVLVP